MHLTSEQKRNLIISTEGSLLRACSESGQSFAGEVARCQINGLMNAIMRIEGNQAAASFSFELSDRVCGGLTDPEDFRNIPSRELQDKAFDIAAQKTKKAVLTSVWWWGFFCGACAMAALTYWRFHG